MRARWLGLLCLFVAGSSLALDPPDHEKWQAGVNASRAAIGSKDVNALDAAVVAVFEQAIRMADRDARLIESSTVLGQALNIAETADSHAHTVALLKKLNSLTAVPGGLANPIAWMPPFAVASDLARQRDFAGARAVLADIAKRGTADFGAPHAVVRQARQQEAGIAAAMGDYDGALSLLSEVAESTRRAFGPTSPEYAEALVSTARLHIQREDYGRASALANEARALLQARPPPTIAPLLSLGAVLEDVGELASARDIYQRTDLSGERNPATAAGSTPVLIRLARLNARLGDGAAARSLMTRATEVARSALTMSPGYYLDALISEASIYSMAGLYDRATESLARCEPLLSAMSPEQGTYARRRLAAGFTAARKFDKALELADGLLRAARPESEEYASAAAIAARAAAQTRAPRTQLAQSAIDLRRRLQPGREPYYEIYSLALSYAAEGRWQESLDLQQRIIDDEAKRGPYETDWEQWRSYAQALEHVGRAREASAVTKRVVAETAPLVAALQTDAAAAQGLFIAERNAFGFKVELTDSKWKRWSAESTGWSMASFVVQYHPEPTSNEATLAVIPVLLPDGIDSETAVAGLLITLNHDRGLLRPWSKESLKGYEYRFTATDVPGQPYTYTGRLLVEEHRIYLVVATAFANSPRGQAAAASALDQVTLAAAPDPKSFGEADRKLHSSILNKVATGMGGPSGSMDKAMAMYEAARQFDATVEVLQNIIFVDLRLGRFQEARNEINLYPGGPAAAPDLFLARAWAEQRLGDTAAAIADYGAGFAAGLRDDDMVARYVTLLLDQQKEGEAIAFLDGYSAAKSSPDITALQALVSFRVADQKRLAAALEALMDPKRSSPQAALVGALVHKQRGGVDELGKFVEGLPTELKSGDMYVFLAAAQIEAKRTSEAAKTVAMGRALAPNDPTLKKLEQALKSQQGPVL